ncbi:AT-hook motif nuclear-localized protein 5-like [Cynara cardunculus var. scolymus]|uniref:AT-hook motif nuclear-localized protein 5-like n=1 Tax=Cynara cardunculus var. scolymus TaxID=59895 RepID=UPI000D62E0EA|nr:AT-hook motif nuclear-localized protein 5-like [Cynara cardunculus var. scolymus]
MDGREGMTSFYLNRGGVSGSGNQTGGLHVSPPGFKTQSNPNMPHGHTNIRMPSSMASSFQVEHNSSPSLPHGINMAAGGGGGGGVVSITTPGSGNASVVKKKRGRPRKYARDESDMELGLTPASLSASLGSITPTMRKNRGRPPGSGWKQRLANVGEWMNNSAGLAFTPHIIHVSTGEDVAEKILSFAQQRPRALCILSANGAVCAVALRQFTSSGGAVTYEGHFDILHLSGSYLLSENGGPQKRTGGLSISVCSGDGNVIGGAIGGRLIASSLVQVVVCSFVYGGNNVKAKTKTDGPSTDDGIELNETSPTASQHQTQSPVAIGWQPDSRASLRNSRTEIDLTRG